jgi:hypothetical protein
MGGKALITDVMQQAGRIEQDHRTLKRLEELVATSEWLAKVYEDADGARKEELAAMAPGR